MENSSPREDGALWDFSPDRRQDCAACFAAFDSDGDGLLALKDFGSLCSALFRSEQGKVYNLNPKLLSEIFNVFDLNEDGFVDREEFIRCWNLWIEKVVRPVSALLVVDVQNDFISGSLAMSMFPAQHRGEEVVPSINRLLDSVPFHAVFYSQEVHPPDHASFLDNLHLRALHPTSPVRAEAAQMYDTVLLAGPPLRPEGLSPRHCELGTWGAELHPELRIVDGAIMIVKGMDSEVEAFSAFWDNMKLHRTPLLDHLKAKGVTDIFVCGIAYECCVGASAMDALACGFRCVLVEDCCRGAFPDEIEATRERLRDYHGVIVNSSQVLGLVRGHDRRAELGYKLAQDIARRHQYQHDQDQELELEEPPPLDICGVTLDGHRQYRTPGLPPPTSHLTL